MESTFLTDEDIKFPLPLRMLVCGCTGVGKSSLLFLLLKYRERLMTGNFDYIIYSFPQINTQSHEHLAEKLKQLIPDICIYPGVPNFEELIHLPGKKLVI